MSTSLKIAVILLIIAAAANIFLFSNDNLKRSDILPQENVSVQNQKPSNVETVDGKQTITIKSKGGYSPKNSVAKADIPTVIKMVTDGTFDCGSAVSIPALGYQSNLPITGETLIEVPAQKKGTVLQGTCSMGMYNFSIKFE